MLRCRFVTAAADPDRRNAFPETRNVDRLSRARWLAVTMLTLWACCTCTSNAQGAENLRLAGLTAQVEVYVDNHGIPHIYAQSWMDAARALGYLHATDRLWQMDLFRRQASGRLAELMGRERLEADILMRQLGIRRGCEELWNSDRIPAELRAELEAYAEGVNSKIAELGDDHLPLPFQLLNYKPQPWTPVDTICFSKYMGWDQSGTFDDLWFGQMVDKFGIAAAEELWPMERPYEVPAVRDQVDRHKLDHADLRQPPGIQEACAAAFRKLERTNAWFLRGASFGSNNWAVDGTKTQSKLPIVANDPHLGFMLPSIWYTAHVSVRGKNVAGVTFPGGPVVIIGHNDQIAWGVTNMQADAVDFYIETIKPDDPKKYRHRGEWKPLERVVEDIPVRGESPHHLEIDSTVHGPIIHREGKSISLAWTGLGPTTDAVALWRVSRAEDLEQFLSALDLLVVPALSVVYGDIHGTIAIHPCGDLPLRRSGGGRVPMDGASGESDWQGMIPRRKLPLAVNPAAHYVASANGRPQPLGYPYYLGWMWDPSYRARRIHQMLSSASDLSIDSMKKIQTDHYDLAAARFLPALIESIQSDEGLDDLGRKASDVIRDWNYVASLDTPSPTIWMRWLEHYRSAVWDDEWESRGIPKEGGSWGFSGDNRREPMLEVLEFLTRENPNSAWFDDHKTDMRETRDDIARRSFISAIASLKQQLGSDLANWKWEKVNILSVRSLTQQVALNRGGMPVVGDALTVNPGGDVGTVGGGASWRMIVDFGHPAGSVGVYPGGQSENPASPLYDDQIPVWARGEYLPLNMIGDSSELPAEARAKSLVFVP